MTIGLLVSELKDAYVRDLCLGAKAAAKDHKADLIIFPGKLMAADTGHNEKKPYEFQHTAVFDFIDDREFDVLIIDIEHLAKKAPILKKEEFLSGFGAVPVLTITEQSGFTSINLKGTKENPKMIGYRAVTDALIFAKTGSVSDEDELSVYTEQDVGATDGMATLDKIGSEYFRRRYVAENPSEEVMEVLAGGGFKNAGLFLFAEPAENQLTQMWSIPEMMQVGAILTDGKITGAESLKHTAEDGTEVPEGCVRTTNVFKAFMAGRHRTWIAKNIFNEGREIGLFITEFTPMFAEGYVQEMLMHLITGAVRVSYCEKRLAESFEEIKANKEMIDRDGSVLDHMGDQDYLTGIPNRRGFFAKAYDLLKSQYKDGTYANVAYIDIDSIKMINEAFGREEGDGVVKKIAKILDKVFGEEALIGRVRGNEFAVLLITSDAGRGEVLRSDMAHQNAKLVAENDTPYLIHLQSAICTFAYQKDLSLREMLAQTDDHLQKVKTSV